jgi:hypothetical protein
VKDFLLLQVSHQSKGVSIHDSHLETETVTEKLSESDDDAYCGRTRTERAEEWSRDAPSAFVSEIGEEIDDANGKDKAKSYFRQCCLPLFGHQSLPVSFSNGTWKTKQGMASD